MVNVTQLFDDLDDADLMTPNCPECLNPCTPHELGDMNYRWVCLDCSSGQYADRGGKMSFDEEYSAVIEPLEEFGKRITGLLEDLLQGGQIDYHSVRYRVKRKESASRKLNTHGNEYASVTDLRDLLGVRVITHFADHVEAVGKLVRAEFEIDPERSVDKGKLLDPDRFGYLSLHYIAKVSSARAALPEWSRFAGLGFEVQIRSILQHSWAEIEHDLGYKSPTVIPPTIRRRFSRLAGVLELADDEFRGIRKALESHARRVDTSLKAGRSIPIDQDSIQSLAVNSPLIRRIDQAISDRWRIPLASGVDPTYAANRAEEILGLDIKTTDELLRTLERDERGIVEFAAQWFERSSRRYEEPFDAISPGISTFYLYLHLAVAGGATPKELRMFRGEEDGDEWDAFVSVHDSIFQAGR